jgi:hypothetical protein
MLIDSHYYFVECPNIAKYAEALQTAQQVARIPEDWTITVMENKPTGMVMACAPQSYGLITPEKYNGLE